MTWQKACDGNIKLVDDCIACDPGWQASQDGCTAHSITQYRSLWPTGISSYHAHDQRCQFSGRRKVISPASKPALPAGTAQDMGMLSLQKSLKQQQSCILTQQICQVGKVAESTGWPYCTVQMHFCQSGCSTSSSVKWGSAARASCSASASAACCCCWSCCSCRFANCASLSLSCSLSCSNSF